MKRQLALNAKKIITQNKLQTQLDECNRISLH